MVLHTHVDGADTRFSNMAGPLANNPLEKWLGVIRRGTYQEVSEDSWWAYEPVSYLWSDIELDSEYIDDGLTDEGIKYQEKLDYQEQEEVVLVPRSNPRRLIRGDQIALSQLKSDIERSKEKLFLIENMSVWLNSAKFYLVHVDMEKSDLVDTSNYGVYRCGWHIIQYEDCNKYPTMECRFWP